ncbi:MAG: hypothetical protein IJN57_08500 [Oscillospiraceae bacterium]|nr:hypothetical protein [Oscillospiraceae bacterium]
MNLQMIASLFTLFSGEENQEKYLPLLTTAVQEVQSQLVSGADGSAVRLCYLAAAIANLRYTQIYGARDKALATYAGTIAYQTNAEQQLRFAMHLVQCYRALCRDLLRDGEFVFVGIRGH